MPHLSQLLITGLLFVLGSSANAYHWSTQPGHHYDHHGRYQGRIDDSGRAYDAKGQYAERYDNNGRHYDHNGRYLGHETGRYRGQVK